MRGLVVTLALLSMGCVHMVGSTVGRVIDEQRTPRIPGPERDRCQKLGKGAARGRCDEAKYLAEIYVRKLAVGDQVCLEGGFGEQPTGACLARAAVIDTGSNALLVEVRDAKPDSRWAKREIEGYWMEETALVDLYLAEAGY